MEEQEENVRQDAGHLAQVSTRKAQHTCRIKTLNHLLMIYYFQLNFYFESVQHGESHDAICPYPDYTIPPTAVANKAKIRERRNKSQLNRAFLRTHRTTKFKKKSLVRNNKPYTAEVRKQIEELFRNSLEPSEGVETIPVLDSTAPASTALDPEELVDDMRKLMNKDVGTINERDSFASFEQALELADEMEDSMNVEMIAHKLMIAYWHKITTAHEASCSVVEDQEIDEYYSLGRSIRNFEQMDGDHQLNLIRHIREALPEEEYQISLLELIMASQGQAI